MIRINDDWVVDVDEFNYTLKKDLHKKTPRKNPDGTSTMVDSYKTRGYYSNLQSALNRLCDEMVVDKLSGADMSLKEAIVAIEECTREWRNITKEILGVK